MKERPVIFNSEMVRAILDGRKTQTRRLVPEWQRPKHYPENDDGPHYNWMAVAQSDRRWGYGVFGETEEACAKELSTMAPCPFGNAGDRLWVRETFMDLTGTGIEATTGKFEGFAYRADTPAGSYGDEVRKEYGLKWTPSLHMPRKACRILLEITAVRVERLNDISEEDAKAEGVAPSQHIITPPEALYRVGFLKLWQSIYGEESWGANPWVWVIEFRRVGGA
ncbi:Uncharacterised protein [Serratia marcescens]|uniref:hypothetical protein n=1 Tax=Serratia marcescens TaxID=615 RepID=UPI000745465E|nr:hypothetical protein [Serratia marcescens]CVE51089.1 Uncharacterised protein [Serratia marcescens]